MVYRGSQFRALAGQGDVSKGHMRSLSCHAGKAVLEPRAASVGLARTIAGGSLDGRWKGLWTSRLLPSHRPKLWSSGFELAKLNLSPRATPLTDLCVLDQALGYLSCRVAPTHWKPLLIARDDLAQFLRA